VKEYRLDLKIRNNLILRLIEAAGFKTVGGFCRHHRFCAADVGALVNCRQNPLLSRNSSHGKAGEWCKAARDLAGALGVTPWDLFTADQVLHQLPMNKGSIELSEGDVALLASGGFVSALPSGDAEARADLDLAIEGVLRTLTPREAEVIRRRFGLDGKGGQFLDDVGRAFNLTRERIRQIESKALRKLRHPTRAKILKPYFDLGD
jgi:hypothetical protein